MERMKSIYSNENMSVSRPAFPKGGTIARVGHQMVEPTNLVKRFKFELTL
jgi:hypothetical protein